MRGMDFKFIMGLIDIFGEIVWGLGFLCRVEEVFLILVFCNFLLSLGFFGSVRV